MASRGINKVILIGNLGQDPEVRYMPNGNVVSNISLATSNTWKDKEGNVTEKTEWHRVVFFSRLAEIVEKFLKKGSKVYIEGRLQTRKWQDKEGKDRYTTEIIANEIQMLDRREAGSSNASEFSEAEMLSDNHVVEKPSTISSSSTENFDDDIPF